MTINEVIRRVDAFKPNRFTLAQKLEWLGNIEGHIYNELVLTHENPEGISAVQISSEMDLDTKLIAPFPHDEVYPLYLQSQIDLGNMEISKYNNSKTLFNNAYMTLRDYWNRTHMPVCSVKAFKL